jgi:hypothetical protein
VWLRSMNRAASLVGTCATLLSRWGREPSRKVRPRGVPGNLFELLAPTVQEHRTRIIFDPVCFHE